MSLILLVGIRGARPDSKQALRISRTSSWTEFLAAACDKLRVPRAAVRSCFILNVGEVNSVQDLGDHDTVEITLTEDSGHENLQTCDSLQSEQPTPHIATTTQITTSTLVVEEQAVVFRTLNPFNKVLRRVPDVEERAFNRNLNAFIFQTTLFGVLSQRAVKFRRIEAGITWIDKAILLDGELMLIDKSGLDDAIAQNCQILVTVALPVVEIFVFTNLNGFVSAEPMSVFAVADLSVEELKRAIQERMKLQLTVQELLYVPQYCCATAITPPEITACQPYRNQVLTSESCLMAVISREFTVDIVVYGSRVFEECRTAANGDLVVRVQLSGLSSLADLERDIWKSCRLFKKTTFQYSGVDKTILTSAEYMLSYLHRQSSTSAIPKIIARPSNKKPVMIGLKEEVYRSVLLTHRTNWKDCLLELSGLLDLQVDEIHQIVRRDNGISEPVGSFEAIEPGETLHLEYTEADCDAKHQNIKTVSVYTDDACNDGQVHNIHLSEGVQWCMLLDQISTVLHLSVDQISEVRIYNQEKPVVIDSYDLIEHGDKLHVILKVRPQVWGSESKALQFSNNPSKFSTPPNLLPVKDMPPSVVPVAIDFQLAQFKETRHVNMRMSDWTTIEDFRVSARQAWSIPDVFAFTLLWAPPPAVSMVVLNRVNELRNFLYNTRSDVVINIRLQPTVVAVYVRLADQSLKHVVYIPKSSTWEAVLLKFASCLGLAPEAYVERVTTDGGMVVFNDTKTLKNGDDLQLEIRLRVSSDPLPPRSRPSFNESFEQLSDLEFGIFNALRSMGYELTTEQAQFVATTNKTVEEAVNYVLENPVMFTKARVVLDHQSHNEKHGQLPLSRVPAELLRARQAAHDADERARIDWVIESGIYSEYPVNSILQAVRRSTSVNEVMNDLIENHAAPVASVISQPPVPLELYQARDSARNPKTKEILDWMITSGSYATFSTHAILEAVKRHSSVEACMSFLMEDLPSTEPMAMCQIFQDEYPISQTYVLECRHSHRFSIEGLMGHVRASLRSTESQASHIPACPLSSTGSDDEACRHLMTDREVGQLCELNKLLCAARGEDVSACDEETASLTSETQKLYALKAHQDNGHIRCPRCPGEREEGFWFESSDKERRCVQCRQCGADFCSVCSRSPYHYRTRCEDVLSHTNEWVQWISEGRQAYVNQVAAGDERYRQMQQEFESKRAQHEEHAAHAGQRLQELQGTEDWKAANCKRCPSCNRTIEKLQGCDLMKCGQDYHGGNLQNGCGANFRWSQAPSYTPDTTHPLRVEEFKEQPPEQTARIHHMIAEGAPLSCDVCQQPIIGPRMSCINCPDFNLCLECDLKGLPRGVNIMHTTEHVCRVILQP